MPNFKYVAMTEGGSKVTGTVEAETEDAALQWVASQGYIPSKVAKAGSGLGSMEDINRYLAKVKAEDIILFTKQFRTMFDAGLSIVNVLEVLEQQTDNLKLKATSITIAQDIRRGMALHEAFGKHPKIFSRMYCAMLRAGEASGTLSEVLERLIYLVEHEFKIKKDIKSAMTYPIIVIVVLFIAFIFLLTFVVPQFVDLFAKAGIELPLPTRVCLMLYKGLKSYWYLMILGFIGTIVAVTMYSRPRWDGCNWTPCCSRCPSWGRCSRSRPCHASPASSPCSRPAACPCWNPSASSRRSSATWPSPTSSIGCAKSWKRAGASRALSRIPSISRP